MQTQTFSHMKGGKILGIFLGVSSIAIIILVIVLFTDNSISIDFLSGIMLVVVAGSIAWVAYKFYKPAFTEVTFSEADITSKTHFESEKLKVKDMQGMWFIKAPIMEGFTINDYFPENPPPKSSLIVIGNINRFKSDFELFGLNGAYMLQNSFGRGYAAFYYQKDMDALLAHYFHKIKANNPVN